MPEFQLHTPGVSCDKIIKIMTPMESALRKHGHVFRASCTPRRMLYRGGKENDAYWKVFECKDCRDREARMQELVARETGDSIESGPCSYGFYETVWSCKCK